MSPRMAGSQRHQARAASIAVVTTNDGDNSIAALMRTGPTTNQRCTPSSPGPNSDAPRPSKARSAAAGNARGPTRDASATAASPPTTQAPRFRAQRPAGTPLIAHTSAPSATAASDTPANTGTGRPAAEGRIIDAPP